MATRPVFPTGLFKGLWVTLRTLFTRTPTVMYPLEKEVPVPRARGVEGVVGALALPLGARGRASPRSEGPA